MNVNGQDTAYNTTNANGPTKKRKKLKKKRAVSHAQHGKQHQQE